MQNRLTRKFTRTEFLKASGAVGAGAAYLAAAPATSLAQSGNAPGRPGEGQGWTAADKDGIGTSANTQSKPLFTLNSGRLTEVYYPDLDTPSVYELQFVVTDGESFAHTERDDMDSEVRLEDERALLYRQTNTDREGRYRISKRYVTDPSRDTLLVEVAFETLDGGDYELYVIYNPAFDNGAPGDSAQTRGKVLSAEEDNLASALMCSAGFSRASNGYAGESDGLTDLMDNYRLDETYRSARDGNVVQTGKIDLSKGTEFTLALGFGKNYGQAQRNARTSLRDGFQNAEASYRRGWHEYLGGLFAPPAVVASGELRRLYNVSLMVLHANEDKTYRGAHIASPSIPWGQDLRPDEEFDGGYHLVWSRDLYQAATALIAAGDSEAAGRSLEYLFEVQQDEDGSFPQNTYLDGTPYFPGLQLDEVAFPIVLAWQLERTDAQTYRDHVRPAAEFIVENGPSTPQERWEEEAGYSPSTIAAEIAGLVCAAEIAQLNGDGAAAQRYLDTADEWREKVEDWTVTMSGPHGDGEYYIRINDDTDPDDGAELEINNGGGTYDERRIVDAGFLELVRLGIKPADDPLIVKSLSVVDEVIRRDTPSGEMFYRYNNDGYGEEKDGSPWDGTGVGRLWPLLCGERGEYELAAGEDAAARLRTIAGAANEGLMLAEQVWDGQPPTGEPGFELGEGTGSATPLSWTHAQFVRLAWSIESGRPVEQPSVVADRYLDDA